ATHPPRRQWQCYARRHAGIKAGRAGCTALLLQTKSEQRQSLLGIPVPHDQVPAGLPKPAVQQQGGGL
ncbi:MAG: hypothetical protein ACK56I_35930, partial [bacterium]